MNRHTRRAVFRLAAICWMPALAAAGCGDEPSRADGPESPQACWDRLHQSIVQDDPGLMFDLLSSRDHAALAADLDNVKRMTGEERSSAAEKLRLPPERIDGLSVRQYYVAFCEAARAQSPANRYASARLERIEQQRASARLFLQADDGQALGSIPLVREPLIARTGAGQEYAWFVAIYAR